MHKVRPHNLLSLLLKLLLALRLQHRSADDVLAQGLRRVLQVDVFGAATAAHRVRRVDWGRFSLAFFLTHFLGPTSL